MLCKWENLQNRQCMKYLFSPLYIYIHTHTVYNTVPGQCRSQDERGAVLQPEVRAVETS